MTTVEDFVYSHLSGTSGVATLITGDDGSHRIYPDRPEQDAALPLIIYRVENGQRNRPLSGVDSLRNYTVRIDSWAATYTAARAVAEAVEVAMNGYSSGAVKAVTFEGEANEPVDVGCLYQKTFSVWVDTSA